VGIPAYHDSDLFALDDAIDNPIIGTNATLCHTVVLPNLRSGPATQVIPLQLEAPHSAVVPPKWLSRRDSGLPPVQQPKLAV